VPASAKSEVIEKPHEHWRLRVVAETCGLVRDTLVGIMSPLL
jgi:hypothetical protein